MSLEPITDSELAEIAAALPTSPRLLAELAPKLQQIEVPVEEIGGLLRRDAGMTGRLIAAANSAAYARAEPATSLEEAIACLGFAEVYRIVGAVAANQLADEPLAFHGIDSDRFRENALFVALVTEELAGVAVGDPRTAYTMGLLRSVGKVALDRHARRRGADPAPLASDEPLLAWEMREWGCTSAEVASRILALWRFPDETVVAVREHYEPGASAHEMSHLLHLAAGAADLRGFGLPGESAYWLFAPESFARIGVDEGRLVWAGERAFRTLERITGALA